MTNIVRMLSLTLIISSGLSACSSGSTTQTEAVKETETATSQDKPNSKPAETPPAAEWTSMGDYKFKLEPDIQKGGEAHLDFYVHDAKKDAHVLGLTGTFHITMPDGTKKSLAIEEEKPYQHYHGKLMLEQFGEYQIVAQAAINGQKFNPRFSFTRKQ